MTQAERSRVFVSATPPPFEITSENTLRQSPKGTQTHFFSHTNMVTFFSFKGWGKKSRFTLNQTFPTHPMPEGFVRFDSFSSSAGTGKEFWKFLGIPSAPNESKSFS